MRSFYLFSGLFFVGLGIFGLALPILPTVPFLILAAWCFGKSNPAFERKLLQHPRYGKPIRDWREKGAISKVGKIAATFAFATSCLLAFVLAPMPWPLLPLTISVAALAFIWSRPIP